MCRRAWRVIAVITLVCAVAAAAGSDSIPRRTKTNNQQIVSPASRLSNMLVLARRAADGNGVAQGHVDAFARSQPRVRLRDPDTPLGEEEASKPLIVRGNTVMFTEIPWSDWYMGVVALGEIVREKELATSRSSEASLHADVIGWKVMVRSMNALTEGAFLGDISETLRDLERTRRESGINYLLLRSGEADFILQTSLKKLPGSASDQEDVHRRLMATVAFLLHQCHAVPPEERKALRWLYEQPTN